MVMANSGEQLANKKVSAQSAFVKGMIMVVPASLLPDRFPQHSHIAFCAALLAGFLLQNFIRPRWWGFLPFLVLSLVAVVLNIAFVK